VFEEENTK